MGWREAIFITQPRANLGWHTFFPINISFPFYTFYCRPGSLKLKRSYIPMFWYHANRWLHANVNWEICILFTCKITAFPSAMKEEAFYFSNSPGYLALVRQPTQHLKVFILIWHYRLQRKICRLKRVSHWHFRLSIFRCTVSCGYLWGWFRNTIQYCRQNNDSSITYEPFGPDMVLCRYCS